MGYKNGGFGSAVLEYAAANNFKNKIEILGIPDHLLNMEHSGNCNIYVKLTLKV